MITEALISSESACPCTKYNLGFCMTLRRHYEVIIFSVEGLQPGKFESWGKFGIV